MATDITVPTLGESVKEATVARWFKKVGERVEMDEPLVELETDKVTVEINAKAAGTLAEIKVPEGENVAIGALLGSIGEGGAVAKPATAKAEPAKAEAPKPAAPAVAAKQAEGAKLAPSVERLVEENKLDPKAIPATGKDGRLTKGDVLASLESSAKAPAPQAPAAPSGPRPQAAREERVRMTRLRKRIAERLKQAQNTAAMLTTFNEVDMTKVNEARLHYRETFEKKHGVRLGFMSFFVKASIVALREFPAANGEIDGDDIVYKNYYDIGVAVGTPQGLVVPVLRDADRLSFAEIEKTSAGLGQKARDGKLTIEDLTGGTFTISNGGVYGSLLSTPILNPPQSGILGMHKIQERPVVIGGKIEIRPMMYLALSYDHRIVDGREAVSVLVRIKECLEDPQRILLDM
ncbi:MAG: 2-oxoglutarate dehydrogenase complex dihydrolipoyllysine-residue succinyltransferase [Alphaproteobacteria bacterium]|nr:2-oxoglutarate dehydrogenase complex dihydrolipoyllysine-residue succinyltransferase [Alphaproteobacteria bacterium]